MASLLTCGAGGWWRSCPDGANSPERRRAPAASTATCQRPTRCAVRAAGWPPPASRGATAPGPSAECRGDPSSRAGGPDTSAPYDPGLLVVLPGSRHSSLCQWPSRIARWRPAGTQPWATRSVAINFSGPGRALGFALRDLRCRRAQLAAADRADPRSPRATVAGLWGTGPASPGPALGGRATTAAGLRSHWPRYRATVQQLAKGIVRRPLR